MKNIITKIIKILIIILVILLPIVNSHFFDLIGINLGIYVNGNYEFSKVIFFNIMSGIIILLFSINTIVGKEYSLEINKKIIIPKIIFYYSLILILSTFFSDYPMTSLFGETSKGHGSLMFLNLIGLFIVFINISKKDLKHILKYMIFGSLITIFFGIKEYYFPTFNYGNLSNRAIGTFGHPNYLALYLLVLIPLIISKITHQYTQNSPTTGSVFSLKLGNKVTNFVVIISSIFLLFLTKSVWGIFIFVIYFLYILYNKNKNEIHRNYLILLGLTLLFLIGYIIYNFGLLTKLNSFISRFYIWKTTINIIFSDIKNILIGVGADSLGYTFSNFKVPELYIFENFGYVADRPHNLVLNLFYHFGILGLILFIYSIYRLIKNHVKKKNIFYFHVLILFLIFTIFNFSSISVYLIITLILSLLINKKITKTNSIYYLSFIIISILSIFGSIIYYEEEVKTYSNKIFISENKYYNKLILENSEKKIFIENFTKEDICKELLEITKSPENYFYCGDLFRNYNKEKAKNYYKLGLEKIPNMWNNNSTWNKHYLIKKLFIPGRFYSKKYSNLEKILERVGI